MILLGLEHIGTSAVIKGDVATIKLKRFKKRKKDKKGKKCKKCKQRKRLKTAKITEVIETILVLDKADLENMLAAVNEQF